jgi:hypothetical protein
VLIVQEVLGAGAALLGCRADGAWVLQHRRYQNAE